MAKGKHGRGHHRPPRRRHLQSVPTRPPHDLGEREEALIQSLRVGLRGEPMDLLSVISGILEVTDPRARNPFDRHDEGARIEDLVASFIGTPFAETTAALLAIRALTADEALAARIGLALADRRHPMPDWLTGLGDALVEPDVWLLTHVLGDGDDYLFGLVLPSGHPLSALVYVDHNLGTMVKDAFVFPEPLAAVVAKLRSMFRDDDQVLATVEPATARAVVEEAIEHAALIHPPLESDTWPMCRPLVEWMLRHLPPGGVAPSRPEWSEQDTAALADDFFASPHGAALDHDDERGLVDNLLWFGTDQGPGDPLRWSPTGVEIVLVDWFPRKIVAEVAYLTKLPDVLRAFVRYSHDRRGIRAALTRETLAAVDALEPEYQRVIRSDRPQGPAASLARMMWPSAPDEDLTVPEIMLESLDRAVGGRRRLQDLDVEPLPDEPFEWVGIPDDIRPVVQEILDVCDRCADELLDVEHRTAMRRFLGRAAVGDPAAFRRRASPVRGAAAVAWVICRANDTIGAAGSGLTAKALLTWFGLTGSVSGRAEPLLRANGVDPHQLYGTMTLRTPDLLISARRRGIIDRRDRWLAQLAEQVGTED